MNTVFSLLENAEQTFADAGIPTARLDAEVLLAHCLGLERSALYLDRAREVSPSQHNTFATMIERRAKREPLAYLTGTREFWSIPIHVTPDVLIPRPETEGIVEEVIKRKKRGDDFFLLDVCTGSGCIVAALAKEFPQAKFIATDISAKAVACARRNVEASQERVVFFVGDLFEALPAPQQFDIITANPPYGAPHDPSFSPETRFEPALALYAQDQGFEVSKRILHKASEFLKPGGHLILEMGMGQAALLTAVAKETKRYRLAEVVKDLAGIERILCLQVFG